MRESATMIDTSRMILRENFGENAKLRKGENLIKIVLLAYEKI
jgi:hypothetical protein